MLRCIMDTPVTAPEARLSKDKNNIEITHPGRLCTGVGDLQKALNATNAFQGKKVKNN